MERRYEKGKWLGQNLKELRTEATTSYFRQKFNETLTKQIDYYEITFRSQITKIENGFFYQFKPKYMPKKWPTQLNKNKTICMV